MKPSSMNVRKITVVFSVSWLFMSGLFAQKIIETDVLVYGGTSAGVIAAYTAQKLGKRAILIEPGQNLGGMSSGGLGYTDIGNKYAITGLARDFYRRIGSHYGKFEQWIFEPHVAENLFTDYVKRGGYQVMYQMRVKEVKKTANAIRSVIIESAVNPASATNIEIRASMFIDCGYEGDLMAKAGVSYTVGRESNSQYNETINGVQLMHGHQFPDGIDPYRIPGKPESGLLWGISEENLPPNGTGDKKVQAYNYRICLSSDPQNQVPIARPEAYDSTKYELLVRLFDAFPQKRKLNDYLIWSHMPNHKTDINNRGGFSTDMIGMNYDYPDAGYDERKQIIRDHELYTKGLLYFYGHDSRVPKPLRDEMLVWGYPKDEYVTNGHWSPQLYVREARRMIGSYVMTQANCEGKEVVSDGVGMAAYTMDSHNIQRLVVNGQVKNEGNVEVGGFGPYPIAYRSIIPKATEATNLFVPVCLSATHIAYGSIRMEPVFMVLAQSAATAAVMAIDAKTPIQNVDVVALQQKLKRNPLADGSAFDVLVDNDDEGSVKVTGNWVAEKKGGYGPTFLIHDKENAAAAAVRFTPNIPEKGRYKAFAYFPKVTEGSSQTVITVFDGKRGKEITIKESDVRVEGQTSGEWVFLGAFDLPRGTKSYAEVSGRLADGRVIADAVIWVPVK
jgi:ribulose 1,5-bisphosphate synthetase/thiazole synthase